MIREHPQPSAAPQAPPDQTHPHTNRLINSTSPYLLQHAHNPVDWYPWGAEAIERARREDKPIFLSIGYAACHWCHVMEREVFEKPSIAAVMNEQFINIKVDREERPDLDELYMLATQLMTGSGGWPMSVWLTPGLEPFYAGTYFPPEDGYGRPGFVRLERALADAWRNRRKDLEEQARRVVEAIRMHADETGKRSPAPIQLADFHAKGRQWIAMAIEQMADRFDPANGGLGSAPKFPPHQALQLWTAVLADPHASPAISGEVRPMLQRTLEGMARGGIYDHVAGAFARYSTDERWLVPHFEKMLYDSAQLVPTYAAASALLSNPDFARVARETLDFFLREMCGENHARGAGPGAAAGMGAGEAFFSSLDADSEGQEGKYYVWTIQDVRAAVASADDADLVIAHFGITEHGNWHESPVEGASVLAIAKSVDDLACEKNIAPAEIRRHLDAALHAMRAYRDMRPRPGLDDKILTSWNGLMVSGLAIAGRLLREPKYLEAAHRLIGFLLMHHMEGGRRLLRVSRRRAGEGAAHTDGFLDDHAFLLNGLMDLIDSTTPTSLPGTMARKRALELADTLIRDFQDGDHGGFFYTGPQHEKLFARMKNAADNATPSPNGVAIRALLRLARVSGKEQYREVALRAIGAFEEHIARRPEYFPTILLALLEDQQAHEQRIGVATSGGALPLAVVAPEMAPQESGSPASGLLTLSIPDAPTAKPGAQFDITLRLTVADGYHIQSADPTDREAFKTLARLRSPAAGNALLISQEWAYPPPETKEGATGYFGTIEFRAHCRLSASARPGPHTLRATILAQPCSAFACLPPDRISADFTLQVEG